MISVNESKLNSYERRVLEVLADHVKDHPEPRIVDAADICGCSVSLVSKAIRKAGFRGYRQFIRYLKDGDAGQPEKIDELERLKAFLDDFDSSLVEDFVDLLVGREKVVLFGYGPSHLCAQYIEYKLRLCLRGYIITPPDEQTVRKMIDHRSLLIILTTTGQYRSFQPLIRFAESRGSDIVVVSEEFNRALMDSGNRYLFLSRYTQSEALEPHEKTRTIFFIFFEQVIQRLIRRTADPAPVRKDRP